MDLTDSTLVGEGAISQRRRRAIVRSPQKKDFLNTASNKYSDSYEARGRVSNFITDGLVHFSPSFNRSRSAQSD